MSLYKIYLRNYSLSLKHCILGTYVTSVFKASER